MEQSSTRRRKLSHFLDVIRRRRSAADDYIDNDRQATFQQSIATTSNHEPEADTWAERKRFLYLGVEEAKIFGFEQHIKVLVDKLLDPSESASIMISIVGMAGVGKTTLAKIVYKSVEHHFDCAAMIHISPTPNKYQLLLDLAGQVGFKLDQPEQLQENDLEANLGAYLANKRYVILVDDLWDIQSWHSLAITITTNCKMGSRIISTSRNKETTLSVITTNFVYELQPLDRKDSWNIFSELVLDPLKLSYGMKCIINRIMEKCGGVPLALVSAAHLLPGRATNEDDLRRVLEIMVKDGGICSSALALSYRSLPPALRSCFLYFGLFPKDSDLFASDIINQWIADGLGRQEIPWIHKTVGEDHLTSLAANSMIQVSSRRFDGKIRTFRIPEIIHSFCVWRATENGFLNPQATTVPEAGVGRVIISSWGKIPGSSATARNVDIHTVVCSDEGFVQENQPKQVEEFFKGSELVRVLVVGSDQLPYCLTKGLRNLKLLRYLGCRDHSWRPVQVKLPSVIGKLKRLLTLDLRNVEYDTIPDGIWKLEQLRHILLRKLSLHTLSRIDIGRSKQRPKRIKVNLPNLKTLYVVPGQLLLPEILRNPIQLIKLGIDCPTDTVTELLPTLNYHFSAVEILWLRCQPASRATLDLSKFLRCQRLHLDTTTVPKHEELPPNVVKLVLLLKDVNEDPMQVLKRLHKLKILKLYVDKCSMDGVVCSQGPDAFLELEELELHLPFYLRKLTVEEHAMPKIKKVSGLSTPMLLQVPERIRALCVGRIH